MNNTHEVVLANQREKEILEKLRTLPPEMFAAVEKFVDSLSDAQSGPVQRNISASPADAFTRVWHNPEDADYDSL